MTTTYTPAGRRNLLATSADEPVLVLCEITHPDLSEPIRVVNDTQNVTIQDAEYVACPFQLTWPDDVDQQQPKGQLQVDNIGRELTQWLEYSNGGKGAKCRLMQALRSDPSVLEYDITLDLTDISIDNQAVTGTLGYLNTMSIPAVALRFDPATSPGLF